MNRFERHRRKWLAGVVAPPRAFLHDVMHFNDNGSELAANTITEHLAPLARKPIQNTANGLIRPSEDNRG
ncbi:MAG: hypothetical protein HQ494_02235 [Rhodospirillales bacterium]|nr:hypothetical protein [Rhodospirillales bacterium]